MKYLLVILLILVVFWLWQYERRTQKEAASPQRPPPAPRPPTSPTQTGNATEIVACSVCQVHLPRTDALLGRSSKPYCCETHRREAEH